MVTICLVPGWLSSAWTIGEMIFPFFQNATCRQQAPTFMLLAYAHISRMRSQFF